MGTPHALAQHSQSMETKSKTCNTGGHTENFVGEFDAGSRADCKTQPIAGMFFCVAVSWRVYLVSAAKIRAVLQHINSPIGVLCFNDLR